MAIDSEELLLVVDENNQPVKPVSRAKAISQKLWRRASAAMIYDSGLNILCQQRSENKDERAGLWTCFFGGKASPGESELETLKKELKEEIGLTVNDEEVKFVKTYKCEDRYQFESMFIVKKDYDLNKLPFEEEEIKQIRLHPLAELKKLLAGKPNSWAEYGYEMDLIKIVEEQGL